MKNLITLLTFLFFAQIMVAQEKIIIHKTSTSNISGHKTILDHPSLNNNPDAILFSSHCYSCLNTNKNNLSNNALIYDDYIQRWIIFNVDISQMQEDLTFFVYIVQDPNYGFTRLSQTNSPYFNLSHPLINNIEDEEVAAIHLSKGEVFPHRIGISFDYDVNRHRVITENQENFLELETNVMVIIDGEEGIAGFKHISRQNNTDYVTYLDHPLLNLRPNARFVFTHYKLNIPTSEYNQYYDKTLTAVYDTFHEKWAIAAEDSSPVPINMIFNVFVDEYVHMDTDESLSKNTISVSPNPASQFVRIDSKDPVQKISFINSAGQNLKEVNVGVNLSNNISIADLPKGVYILKIQTDRTISTEKLIIQ